jgi:lauroyl/myristoyl acyltransferase
VSLESLRHIYLRRVIAPTLRMLGPRITASLARRLARGIFAMKTPGVLIAESRLRDALAASKPETTQSIIAGMYEHLADFWVECLFARRLMRPDSWRQVVDVVNEPLLQSLVASDRGCLLASCYLGNPAMCAFALGQIFRPVHVLIDLDSLPALRTWHSYLRNIPNVQLIHRKSAGTMLPSILQRGGAVWLIAEHHRPRGPAIETSFLGRIHRSYPTIERFAEWSGARVGIVTCTRSETCRFRFTLTCHDVLSHQSATPTGELTKAVLSTLESAILKHPRQYLWNIPTVQPMLHRVPSASPILQQRQRILNPQPALDSVH